MYNNLYANIPQRYEVIHVNGENGARALQMAPNSSVLLLDDTAPLVWLATTDGAGYKSVTPFKIEHYTPEPAPDINSIIERLNKLEEKLNVKSDNTNTKRKTNESTE